MPNFVIKDKKTQRKCYSLDFNSLEKKIIFFLVSGKFSVQLPKRIDHFFVDNTSVYVSVNVLGGGGGEVDETCRV